MPSQDGKRPRKGASLVELAVWTVLAAVVLAVVITGAVNRIRVARWTQHAEGIAAAVQLHQQHLTSGIAERPYEPAGLADLVNELTDGSEDFASPAAAAFTAASTPPTGACGTSGADRVHITLAAGTDREIFVLVLQDALERVFDGAAGAGAFADGTVGGTPGGGVFHAPSGTERTAPFVVASERPEFPRVVLFCFAST